MVTPLAIGKFTFIKLRASVVRLAPGTCASHTPRHVDFCRVYRVVLHPEGTSTLRSISLAAKLAASAALPLALVSCSSSSKIAPASAGTTSAAAPSPAQTSADPDAGLLTGTQLKAALVPASFFASGFTLDSSGVRDSGDAFQAPATANVPTPDCTKLGGTSWIALTGIDGVSFAQNDYINKSSSFELAQEIDVYQGSTAQTVFAALGKLAAACPSFTDAQTSSKVTVTEKAVAGIGDGAFVITLTDSAWQNGTTLEAVRVGTAVITVLSTDGSGGNGAGSATKLSTQIAAALKGKA
jgi:hypothetical protein